MSEPTRDVLRHVVLFSFTETATPADIEAIETAFAALPAQIAEIMAFEWGTDVSVEDLAAGYTHCFLVTFAGAADRDAYLVCSRANERRECGDGGTAANGGTRSHQQSALALQPQNARERYPDA